MLLTWGRILLAMRQLEAWILEAVAAAEEEVVVVIHK